MVNLYNSTDIALRWSILTFCLPWILDFTLNTSAIYIYSGILLSYKKVYNSAICNTMDEVGEYNSKWNKSDLERQILYNVNYSWNIKIKQMNITKAKQIHRYREQTNGY